MMQKYQICFYIDDGEKYCLEHKGFFTAADKSKAYYSAIQKFNPKDKYLYTIIEWSSPKT